METTQNKQTESKTKKTRFRGYTAWTFTHWITTEDEIQRLLNLKCKYIGFSKEICPQTGRLHLQGFISFKDPKTVRSLNKKFSDQTHFERMDGTYKENLKYCSKTCNLNNPFHSKGTLPLDDDDKGQLGKKYWSNVFEELKSGVEPHKLLEKEIITLGNYRNVKLAWKEYLTDSQEEKRKQTIKPLPDKFENSWEIIMNVEVNEKKRHYWIFSELCDTGKTTFLRFLSKNFFCAMWNFQEKFQEDLQTDSQIILIDGLSSSSISIAEFENLTSGFYQIKKKSKPNCHLNEQVILVVTSNYSIQHIFPDKENTNVMLARFKQIRLELKTDLDAENQKKLNRKDGMKAIGKYI